MDIRTLAQQAEGYVIGLRRDLHRHPELSGEEKRTLGVIERELTGMGIPYTVVPNGGILGFLDGADPSGKTVLLRADCDALPIRENPENLAGPRCCVSENDGVMHACGHDGHMAMALGAAKILSQHREAIHGRLILLFERGEEGRGNLFTLLAYMEQQGITADTCWGAHLYADLESGRVSLRPGPVMATGVAFDITIHGTGGHGSRPDQANSPIDCFVAIYQALQAARMTKISPFEQLTFSVGTVSAGSVGNVIPSELRVKGGARVLDREKAGKPFAEELRRKVDGLAAAYGCTVTYHRLGGGGPLVVYNDPACTELAQKLLAEQLGEEAIVQADPWMGSESFSLLQRLYPGVFALIGIRNPEKGTGAAHHNEYFDIDEDALKLGVIGAVAYALGFLEHPVETDSRKWHGTLRELYADKGDTPEMIERYYELLTAPDPALS